MRTRTRSSMSWTVATALPSSAHGRRVGQPSDHDQVVVVDVDPVVDGATVERHGIVPGRRDGGHADRDRGRSRRARASDDHDLGRHGRAKSPDRSIRSHARNYDGVIPLKPRLTVRSAVTVNL